MADAWGWEALALALCGSWPPSRGGGIMARPVKLIDIRQVEELARIGCTEEVAPRSVRCRSPNALVTQ